MVEFQWGSSYVKINTHLSIVIPFYLCPPYQLRYNKKADDKLALPLGHYKYFKSGKSGHFLGH